MDKKFVGPTSAPSSRSWSSALFLQNTTRGFFERLEAEHQPLRPSLSEGQLQQLLGAASPHVAVALSHCHQFLHVNPSVVRLWVTFDTDADGGISREDGHARAESREEAERDVG